MQTAVDACSRNTLAGHTPRYSKRLIDSQGKGGKQSSLYRRNNPRHNTRGGHIMKEQRLLFSTVFYNEICT